MHRILASLGRRSDLEVANLRAALAASRAGRVLVVPDPKRDASKGTKTEVLDNLRYLDVALTLEMWERLGLRRILEDALGGSERIPAAKIVAALVTQRCLAPASKLHAVRWIPRTALPELLDLDLAHLNNSRIHRVLERLDAVDAKIQERIPGALTAQKGRFAVLFADLTDTWFVGQGPTFAEKGKTKEGHYRRKINILLLCDEAGAPLRWKVLPGRRSDAKAMLELFRDLQGVDWAREAMVVCDRAMGATSHVLGMLASGVRFLTAISINEFAKYAPSIPLQSGSWESGAVERDQACRAAERLGMTQVGEDLYVLDLGIMDCSQAATADSLSSPGPASPGGDPRKADLELALEMRDAVSRGECRSLRQAGRKRGLDSGMTKRITTVLHLSEDLQAAIRNGEASRLSRRAIARLAASKDPEEQRATFARELSQAPAKLPLLQPQPQAKENRQEPGLIRRVLTFNPDVCMHQREAALEKLNELHELVREINRRLSSPRTQRTRESAHAIIDRRLRSKSMTDLFDLRIVDSTNAAGFEVRLELEEDAWRRRRRYDGYSVLIAHPDVLLSPEQIARTYRAKNEVERDFHVIKGIVDVRPVRHRVDAKVRAHVTLCMLALAIERELGRRLARSTANLTPSRALELLESCMLNRLAYPDEVSPVYGLTRTKPDQERLLAALGLQHLADEAAIALRAQPR